MRHLLRLLPLLLGPLSGQVTAQYTTVPFTSGPIPLCDTITFTANVSGIGTLYPPGWNTWTYSGKRAPGPALTGRWRPSPGPAAKAAS